MIQCISCTEWYHPRCLGVAWSFVLHAPAVCPLLPSGLGLLSVWDVHLCCIRALRRRASGRPRGMTKGKGQICG